MLDGICCAAESFAAGSLYQQRRFSFYNIIAIRGAHVFVVPGGDFFFGHNAFVLEPLKFPVGTFGEKLGDSLLQLAQVAVGFQRRHSTQKFYLSGIEWLLEICFHDYIFVFVVFKL